MREFKLEEFFSKYEFTAPYLLCCSDVERWNMKDILALANKEELSVWNDLHLGYTEPYGHPALREQIVESLYPNLQSENILTCAGAEEGIYAALSVLCKPGDHAITLTPCYQSLTEVPRAKGVEVSEVSLKEAEEWRINIEDIREEIKDNTKIIVINFPHNPTGQVITQAELESLVDLCEEHDLWLFSDEVYRLLGTPKEGWSLPAASVYHKAISLGVMSKAYGMPGLRVGWLVCQDTQILHQIRQMKDYLSICNSAPAEILSLIALKNHEHILSINNQVVAHNLSLFESFISQYSHLFSWVASQGGCVGFVKCSDEINVETFCQNLVDNTGILLMPGSIYDVSTNHFRVGLGRKNMPESLERLASYVGKEYS